MWGLPNFSECQTIEITRIWESTEVVYAMVQQLSNNEIAQSLIDDMQDIAKQLVNVINGSEPVFPRDLYLISDIMQSVTS